MRYSFVKKENALARLTVAFGLFFLFSCAGNTPDVNTSPATEVSSTAEEPSYEEESPEMDYTSEETVAPKATGGTIEAMIKLIEKQGGIVVGACVFIELPDLKGRDKLKGYPVFSAVSFEGE